MILLLLQTDRRMLIGLLLIACIMHDCVCLPTQNIQIIPFNLRGLGARGKKTDMDMGTPTNTFNYTLLTDNSHSTLSLHGVETGRFRRHFASIQTR